MIAPVPNDYSLSPAVATPHLVINHDVTDDLDSSTAFEGPEKLLEVWFAPSPAALPASAQPNGLKAVPSETWVTMLDMVNCKILSVLESDSADAYLLSESSMFVWPHKLILKTCGTTTLLLGLKRMLHIAAENAGFPFHNSSTLDENALATPYRVFYSRKNFLFPDKQRGPHRSWKQEVKYLDDMFEGGSAYMVGKMNGDHWYLYMTSPADREPTPPHSPTQGLSPRPLRKIPTGTLDVAGHLDEDADQLHDETLEILMTDLDQENAKQFYFSQELADSEAVKAATNADADDEGVFANADSDLHTKKQEPIPSEGHALGTIVTNSCGLNSVFPTSSFPDARVDSYLFTPCGYSANGLVPPPAGSPLRADGTSGPGQYWTVHVTPEPDCSFASFETNVPAGQDGRTTSDIINKIIGVFKPGRFSVTLFDAKGRAGKGALAAQRLGDGVQGYKRIDGIVHDFEDYDLVFRFYEKEGWKRRAGTRVGEE